MFLFRASHRVENVTQVTLDMKDEEVLSGLRKMTEVHPPENGKIGSGHYPPVFFFSYNKVGFS